LFDINFKVLPLSMDASVKNHQVISQNMANFSTPNYKRKYISFDDELKKALGNSDQLKLKTNNQKHINNTPYLENVQAKILEDDSKSLRNDGNNVDIDTENSLMIQNALNYSSQSRLMTYAIQRYDTVLRGVK